MRGDGYKNYSSTLVLEKAISPPISQIFFIKPFSFVLQRCSFVRTRLMNKINMFLYTNYYRFYSKFSAVSKE